MNLVWPIENNPYEHMCAGSYPLWSRSLEAFAQESMDGKSKKSLLKAASIVSLSPWWLPGRWLYREACGVQVKAFLECKFNQLRFRTFSEDASLSSISVDQASKRVCTSVARSKHNILKGRARCQCSNPLLTIFPISSLNSGASTSGKTIFSQGRLLTNWSHQSSDRCHNIYQSARGLHRTILVIL